MDTEPTTSKAWYDKKPIIFVLFLIPPIGLYALWKSSRFSENTKWTITTIIAVMVALSMLSDKGKRNTNRSETQLNATQNNANDQQNNYSNNSNSKYWGKVLVSVKGYAFYGSSLEVTLEMNNRSNDEEPISSLTQSEAISMKGDIGTIDIFESDCDGTIPPKGLLKCILYYDFRDVPQGVNLRIGAGILTKAVYFKLQKT